MQPESPLHGLEGLKHMATAITPGIFDESLVTETLEVATEDALLMTSKLAREEGLLVGPSSGANVFAAERVGSVVARAGGGGDGALRWWRALSCLISICPIKNKLARYHN